MLTALNHHAYAVAGEVERVAPRLLETLERLGIQTRGNPDVRSEAHDVFGIDEARALKEAAGRKAVTGGKKVSIVSVRGITKEAQNALLKLCEESPAETHFFLLVPSLEILLPTLRSRLHLLDAPPTARGGVPGEVEAFLRAATPARLKIVQKLLKDAEEEVGKGALVAFLSDIERALASQNREEDAGALQEVLLAEKYSRDRSPSFKLLLEHLALVLPKI